MYSPNKIEKNNRKLYLQGGFSSLHHLQERQLPTVRANRQPL